MELKLYEPNKTYHLNEQVHLRARAHQVNVYIRDLKKASPDVIVKLDFEKSLDRENWDYAGGFTLNGGMDNKGKNFTVACFGHNSNLGMADEVRYIRGTVTVTKPIGLLIEVMPRERQEYDETLIPQQWLEQWPDH